MVRLKTYIISKKERAHVIEMATKKVKEFISDEISRLSEDERNRYLMKVMKYVN